MKNMLIAMTVLWSLTVLLPSGYASPLPTSSLRLAAADTRGFTQATQQEWESVVAAGKKEGIVNLYATAWPPAVRTALTQALKKKIRH